MIKILLMAINEIVRLKGGLAVSAEWKDRFTSA